VIGSLWNNNNNNNNINNNNNCNSVFPRDMDCLGSMCVDTLHKGDDDDDDDDDDDYYYYYYCYYDDFVKHDEVYGSVTQRRKL
jgi:hypothetical protein